MQQVFIIPGLGGKSSIAKIKRILSYWSTKNRQIHLFDSKWNSDESYEDKLKRLISFFDKHSSKDGDNYVVSYSAGGALNTLLVLARPKIKRSVIIAGKNKGAHWIGPRFQKYSPSLKPTVEVSETKLSELKPEQLARIVCLRPLIDEVVARRHMRIKGAKIRPIPFILHVPSIGFALLLQARWYLR